MKKFTENLLKVVNMLSDEKYMSGAEMAKHLGISRTAIWKIIKVLISYGIDITSDNKLGYKTTQKLILLDRDVIGRNTNYNLTKLDIFESINSTNEFLKGTRHQDYQNHICLAEHQSSGNARLKRSWDSPFGQNLYLSIKHYFKKDISFISGLSLITGLSVIRTLSQLNISNKFKIKWPNDIYCEDKKIAGILTEVVGESYGGCMAVIGIGLNVNMTELSNKNVINWTSLKKITGKHFDRNEICISLINNIIKDIEKFSILGLEYFLSDWNNHDYLTNKKIVVKNNEQTIEGEYKGIDAQGNLLLKIDNKIITLYSGDASIASIK
ncbi:biotin--[acetyl-CoA-carboxylase] ligase [Candidatus Bandiella numerosa]|uniref:biotin--[acetyl-CoA-carboxylase] ligase n=1 Tax=Candidatus Bandiella numerosa TaxID=2570586 RepID=UPI00249E3168|nr:biotin--[acetyl-CoA-carboxylase] ligase [Candidatus Bandiella numerosa]WHA05067.1 biotin--[acetyl-CoA-carboxylase] ligase [Candidatus Bandiella numerosa]